MQGLPPGPRFPLITTVGLLRGQLEYVEQCLRTYGDPFTLKVLTATYVISGDPAEARKLFTADPELFGPSAGDETRFLLGDTSLPLVRGERHASDRKLLSPSFHGARMRAYGRIMLDATLCELERREVGATLKAQEAGQAISLDVILEAAFGVSDVRRKARFRDSILRLMSSSSGFLLLLRPLQRNFGGFGPWARFRRSMAEFDALVHEEIAQRRGARSTGQDILHLMMAARYSDGSAMTDHELRDQLFFLLFAGHETTAVAMAWALYELHRAPAELDRLRSEIDALGADPEPDAVAALPYLEAVCNETLRLHPLLPFVPRKLIQPYEFKGYRLPPGTQPAVGVALIHGRAEIYPEPARFRPERFVGRKYAPFEFFPFGGGTRRCLGAAFALYEMKIALAAILRGYRLTLLDTGPVRHVLRATSLGTSTGIHMRLDGRRAPAVQVPAPAQEASAPASPPVSPPS